MDEMDKLIKYLNEWEEVKAEDLCLIWSPTLKIYHYSELYEEIVDQDCESLHYDSLSSLKDFVYWLCEWDKIDREKIRKFTADEYDVPFVDCVFIMVVVQEEDNRDFLASILK